MNARILFVEDDEYVREILLAVAGEGPYEAETCPSAEAALDRLRAATFDIVVTDVRLPGMSGIDLLAHVQRLQPSALSIVITAYGTVDIAVEAMKRGAIDFVTKPFTPDDLLSALRVAASRLVRHTKRDRDEHDQSTLIVGASPSMRQLLDDVATVAPFNTTVLIRGETGTGKELIARAIHARSGRAGMRMVAINCAAIPEHLLEDELFGHVKGAYTGAQGQRRGRFEQANGGTLFLDEIGEMSLAMQAKLLRVLQERQFEPLGSSSTIKVDVRFIAATSANLERRLQEGAFRPDLYYRLNVMQLRVPALRERPSDVRHLAEHLLERFCSSAGLAPKSIDETAMAALLSYRWPGNVRQLQNCMERAAALSRDEPSIRVEHLPEDVRGRPLDTRPSRLHAAPSTGPQLPDEGLDLGDVLARVERELLLQALERTGGNKMQAARLLKMKRTTLVEKLKRLSLLTDPEV